MSTEPRRRERPGRTSPGTALTTTDFSVFSSAANSSFVPLELERTHSGPFHATLRKGSVADVHISEVAAHGHTVRRSSALLDQTERKLFKLTLMLEGRGVLTQDNREIELGPGDVGVYDSDRPYHLDFRGEYRTLVLMVPQRLLDVPQQSVRELAAQRFETATVTSAPAIAFLRHLGENLEQFDGASGVRLARTAMDLVTTMLMAELTAGSDSFDSRRLLLHRIFGYISDNLERPDLGPGSIAVAHSISTRQVHSLFKAHGISVSAWIRARRLERCRRELIDPLSAGRQVAEIASRWGFADPAHFSRTFRAAYGASARDVRAHPTWNRAS